MCDCIRPGFLTPLAVDPTRTQPLDSCMTMARMKRGSTPPDWPTDSMADLSSAVSSSEFGWKFCQLQPVLMKGRLMVQRASKGGHLDSVGQPSAGLPLPRYSL